MKAQPKILVIEDEQKIATLLRDYLQRSDYQVDLLNSGERAVERIRRQPPDLVILDLMLPGKDGLTICREVRAFSDLPILILTAKVDEVDRLVGLEMGADDYICKPFSPREVVARVKAVLRRARPAAETQQITAGALLLEVATRRVTVKGAILHLTPNEFDLLKVLMTHPERVFERSDLIALVQGYDFEGYDRTIDSHIKNIRKKIGAHLPDVQVIKTVYGVGYAFYPPEAETPGRE
ncbi:MAG: response regulator [Desulfosarcinaceae bacterium]|nr:response regulator [Desulfosarcinaceae bacterium]